MVLYLTRLTLFADYSFNLHQILIFLFCHFMDLPEKDISKLVDFFEKQKISDDYSFFQPDDFTEIIEFYKSKNKIDQALNASRLALRHFPYNLQLLFLRSELLILNQEYEHALEILDKITIFDYGNIEAQLTKASILFELGDYEEADDCLDIVFQYDENNIEAVRLKGSILFDLGEFEEAMRYFEFYLTNVDDDAEILRLYAECAKNLNKENEIIEFYQKIVDNDPYSSIKWTNLGFLHAEINRDEEANEYFEIAIALNKSNPHPYFYLGGHYFEKQEYKVALQYYLDALKYNLDNYYALLQIGFCYFYLDDFVSAEEFFNKTVEKEKYEENAYFGLALIAHKKKNFVKAIHYIRRAIKIDEFSTRFQVFLAICLAELGKWPESEKIFIKAVNNQFVQIEPLVEYLMLRYAAGHKDKTIELALDAYYLTKKPVLLGYLISGFYLENDMADKAKKLLTGLLKNSFDQRHILFDYFPFLNSNIDLQNFIETYRPKNS